MYPEGHVIPPHAEVTLCDCALGCVCFFRKCDTNTYKLLFPQPDGTADRLWGGSRLPFCAWEGGNFPLMKHFIFNS